MILKYLYHNKWYSIPVLYFIVSVILKMQGVDITIPCIFNFLFDVNCLGCGMTRSFIELLKLNFTKSLEYNFIAIPFMIFSIYYITKDFLNFRKNYTNSSTINQ